MVVAELTGGNANVMYELGLRHTTGLPTVQLGERGKLPFDIRAIRTVMFFRTEGGLIEARKELVAALRSAVAGEGLAVTATRVWESEDDQVEPTPGSHEAGSPEPSVEDEGPGYLEKLAETEVAMKELSSRLEPVTVAMQRAGEIWTAAGEEATRAEASGGGASAKLAIAERTAKGLEPVADAFHEGVEGVAEILHRVAPGMDYIISRVEAGLEDEELPDEFVTSLATFAGVVEENQEILAGFLETLSGLGQATRSLRRVNDRIAGEVKKFMELSEVQIGWRNRLVKALETEPNHPDPADQKARLPPSHSGR